ncbi:hypothetical protein VTO42DRAFT_2465 [Malbranchea cinnamomea]
MATRVWKNPTGNCDLKRDDRRIIIHFDYDCFYASVFEAENPVLKTLPLAVQQKQIVVTCNYEARRRGLRKLQLIRDAKKICPDVVIVLGEDLSKFRDASKELFGFLGRYVWGGRVERLGFDEVFLDVTSMIDHNIQLLNPNDLSNSFFQLDKSDPTVGFAFDASTFCGPTYPPAPHSEVNPLIPDTANADLDPETSTLRLRLILGSHLANHLRMQLEEHKGYTATVGISTSKLLSKLVGNVHKPRNQTTLIPPYTGPGNNVIRFLDGHDIGQIPGIGSKIARRLRRHVLGRELTSGSHEEMSEGDRVRVGDVRSFPGMGPRLLDEILRGGGGHKNTGAKVWGLINGVDDAEVALARTIPTQVSIEDSYEGLDNLDDVRKALIPLARSLIRRVHIDLTDVEEDEEDAKLDEREEGSRSANRNRRRKWLAHPRTLRLSTRPRLPPNPDGSRNYSYSRVSRSCPMPQFIFSFSESIDALAERLVREAVLPTFRKLHPERSGWKLSLINIAATNMVARAGETHASAGRDIGKMFRTQEHVQREWKVGHGDAPPHPVADATTPDSHDDGVVWESDDDTPMPSQQCGACGALIPHFALKAHETYHSLPD